MKNIRRLSVFVFRIFIHTLMFGIFVYGFSKHYLGLRFFSRTLAIVGAAYLFFTVWMSGVYGKVDIGVRKTKPLFHTIVLNLFVTNLLSFVALRIMTYHDHIGFMSDVLMLLMVFIAQMLVAWIAISIANSWYFVNYVPDKTLVLSNNETYLSKVLNYLNSHQKQYELVEVIESPTLDAVNLNGVGKVFALELDHDFLTDLMKQSYMLDVELYYSSDFGNVIFGNRETFFVDDILLYQYQTRKMTDLQLFGKRLMDIVFSVLGLIVVFPVMLVVSLLIKLDDGGPIIFSQERLTRNGKVFNIYKFRSMKLNSGNQPVTKDDDRITRVGKFIRKFRLDELPQLFNIIKGDMSIVGPRPESVSIEEEILKEVPEFGFRLKVKAGLTGTAQIFGKYNTSARDKLLMDLYYIENFSLFNDLKLMFQTLIVFIKKDSTEGFDKDGK